MSIKTLKRIALVAVTALSLGLFASLPAKAATDAYDLTTAEYIAAGGESGAQVAGALNYVEYTGNVVAAAANTNWTVRVSGAGATISAVAGAGLAIATGSLSATSTVNTALTGSTITINTPAVGTVTVDVYKNVLAPATGIWTSTLEETMTVTVRATATSGVASSATATITAGSTHAAGGTTDGTIAPVSRTVGNQSAVIEVVVKDANAAAVVGAGITASITGAGQLGGSDDETAAGVNTTAATGRSVSVTTAGAGDGTGYITVWSDGTSGVGTITVTAAGTTFTKTVTFYGPLASLKATAAKKVYSADINALVNAGAGVADTYGVLLQGLDAAGVEVPLTANSVTVTSADTNEFESAATQGTVSDDTGKTNQLLLTVDVDTTNRVGGKATVMTYTVGTISTTATLTAGKDAAAAGTQVVTMTTDKASYLPGEKITITVTGKDSTGNALGDGAQALFTAPATSNITLTGALPVASPVLSAGVATYTTYAPFAAGNVVITATANNASASTITATFEVTGGSLADSANAAADAAAEAIDAANAATDAANAAAEAADAATAAAQDAADAVAALATQVNEAIAALQAQNEALRKQITALTNLIIKIQKKVKA